VRSPGGLEWRQQARSGRRELRLSFRERAIQREGRPADVLVAGATRRDIDVEFLTLSVRVWGTNFTMEANAQAELESAIRFRLENGDHAGAATALLRGYGREIFSFLAAVHRGEDDASEVFSLFAEGVWKGVQKFEQRATFRTWAYAIARKASLCYRRDKHRRERRFQALPADSVLSGITEQIRTETLWYLRTEPRSRFAALRDTLPPEDRELLVLRVDRQLAWNDLAQMLRDDTDAPLEGEALRREAARLRKRFQLLTERLREIGRHEGLVPPDKGDR
jgi:RNA polymerase sigma-70 factor (ECF subfamily)